MKLYIGIDPGNLGGIGFVPEHGKAWAIKMPDTDQGILEALEPYKNSIEGDWFAYAALESVHSMPGQGVASSFKFGEGFGKLQMALAALRIPYQRVTPQKWQKALGCLTKGDKNVSKRRAQELFPHLKITHATADSLLLAEFANRTFP